MAVTDWSTNPASNTAIDGINIAEGCPPGNLNNAVRSMMANVRVMYNNLPSTANFAPLNSPSFTGTPIYNGRGGLLHHNNPANSSGRIFVQQAGQATPAMANGDILAEY
jgi:hypothetical protein